MVQGGTVAPDSLADPDVPAGAPEDDELDDAVEVTGAVGPVEALGGEDVVGGGDVVGDVGTQAVAQASTTRSTRARIPRARGRKPRAVVIMVTP